MRLRAGPAVWCVIIPILSAAFAFASTRPPSPLAAADRLLEAVAFRLSAPLSPPISDVVVVAITDETLSAFPYRSPIDRGFLAKLIDDLIHAGVREVGLDVVLDRASEPAKDAELRHALTHARVPVVAVSIAPDTSLATDRRRFLADFLSGVRTGDANLARDRFDNVVRDHVPVHPITGQPSFAGALALALNVEVPTRAFPIAWRRPSSGSTVPIYPAQAVSLLPPGWLTGKVAIIGSRIAGSDEHRTPATLFGPPAFGVEIHAQVLSQLLAGRAVPAPPVPWIMIAAMLVLSVIGMTIGMRCGAALTVLLLAGVGGLLVAADMVDYATTGVLIPILPPLLAFTLAGSGARAWRGFVERRDRRALRSLFSRFVSGQVVDEIMQHRELFMSGGRPRPMELTATVLYADVAGFTTICEQMAPEPLIAWLDAYIDAMSALITAHDGVLLRFIGDGILAVFGVPVPRRDEAEVTRDACNAAHCALAMERAMTELNDAWAAQGLPVGGLRVGVHTGPMVAGSLGTGARMEFCLLGDTANVGARLEQLGKDYAEPSPRYCTIVIGGPTWDRLHGALPGIRIGEVVLRGKQTPLPAYRIDSAAAGRATDVVPQVSGSDSSSRASRSTIVM